MAEEKRINAETLEAFCAKVLTGAGARPQDAAVTAQAMVHADLRGVASHGVIRLESYIRRIETGLINLATDMPLLHDSPATALMDAEHGLGQVAGTKAVDMAVSKAAAYGVSLVSVRNSNHYGASSFYAARAASQNMLAIVYTNGGPSVAPFNGNKALIGTNPFASAVPMKNGPPVVLDMATTVAARGKIRRAALNGESIPLGWALDADGQPTTDPKAVLNGGTLCPFAGPKGAGLSLMVDLFSGVLSGSCLTGQVRPVTDVSGPARVGHMFLVINPAFFSGTENFMRDVAEVAGLYHAQKPADGKHVWMPGEMEAEGEIRRRKEGLALNERLLNTLNTLGASYGAGQI